MATFLRPSEFSPSGGTAGVGAGFSMTVLSDKGTAPLTYQWKKNGIGLVDSGTHIYGATDPYLLLGRADSGGCAGQLHGGCRR